MSTDQPSNQPPVVPAELSPRYYPTQRPRRRWGLWLLIFVLLVGFFGMTMIFSAVSQLATLGSSSDSHIEEKYHSLEHHATNKVAIITIQGMIIEGDGFVKKQIDRVRADKSIKAVVLRVDSPGGTVTGSDYMYHHLVKLRKDRDIPVVVSMGSLAASGGYYVSMACGDEPNVIFAEPTTWTGSIGVIINHYDLSSLAERFGVRDDSIKSHRLKQMGGSLKPMTDEERKIFQGLIDEAFGRFKDIVKQGRPKFKESPEKLDAVATGQVFTSHQAIESGLVDKEGFIEDAIDRAIELAGLTKKNTSVIKYKEPFSLLDGLLATSQARDEQTMLQTVLNLSTPKAWYIFSWPTLQN